MCDVKFSSLIESFRLLLAINISIILKENSASQKCEKLQEIHKSSFLTGSRWLWRQFSKDWESGSKCRAPKSSSSSQPYCSGEALQHSTQPWEDWEHCAISKPFTRSSTCTMLLTDDSKKFDMQWWKNWTARSIVYKTPCMSNDFFFYIYVSTSEDVATHHIKVPSLGRAGNTRLTWYLEVLVGILFDVTSRHVTRQQISDNNWPVFKSIMR